MITWIKHNRLVSILLLAAIGFYAYYLNNAIHWIPYPNSIDYGEGFVMNYAKLWANSSWKWDVAVPPYLTMVYGVGFPTLALPFVKLFGAELWVGRAISFLSAVMVCFLVYLIVKVYTNKKSWALLAALVPATQPIFRDWSMMARVDMPAVMFDVLGLYLVIKLRKSRYMYLVVVPFVFAMMIKLTAVAGLLAALIYLILSSRRQFAIFSLWFISGLASVLLPLEFISHGTYLNHIIVYNNTIMNIHLGTFLFLFNAFAYAFMPLGVLSFAYVHKSYKDKDWTLPSLFFIASLLIDAGTTVRPGASSQYYFEAIVGASICASLALFYLVRLWNNGVSFSPGTAALMGLLIVIFVMYAPMSNFLFPDKQYTEATNDVQSIVSDSQKPIITENPAIALTMGKDLYIEYFIFTNMSRLGYWDETSYVEEYSEQYFDYVVLRVSLSGRIADIEKGILDGNFTDAALKAIDANYSLVYQTVNPYWPYSMYVYEANDKAKNDTRQIVRQSK